jgi:hypothetical protein
MELDKKEVYAWLNRGGLMFEQQCINVFNEAGFDVTPGIHYVDPISQLHREIDFMATYSLELATHNFMINFSLLVECKAHIEPIIAIKPHYDFSNANVFSNLIATKNADVLKKSLLTNAKEYLSYESFSLATTENECIPQSVIPYSGGGNGKSNDQKKDRLFEAMMQSLNASKYLRDESNKSDVRFCNIYIPVVIFDNSLFLAELENEELTPKEYLKVSKLMAFDRDNPYNIFHLVSNTDIKGYAEQVYSEFDDFCDKYHGCINDVALKKPNNSGKGSYSVH